MNPWGYKITLHIYGSGPVPDVATIQKAATAVRTMLGADDFVGVDVRVVEDKPREQVGT